MKIGVLSGSPKGRNSITLQSVHYLAKQFPADDFQIWHIGQQIKQFEKPEKLDALIHDLAGCDLLLWIYPVYTFLAPYQMHRFIELIKTHPEKALLSGKWSTQLTTSKHFYDMTAHAYIEDNARDLGLKVIKGFSADMDDLLKRQGQKSLHAFWEFVQFTTGSLASKHQASSAEASRSGKAKDTLIVTDRNEQDTVLTLMIEQFKSSYPHPVREIDLSEVRMDGGCLGCFNCATDGSCLYKDGFDQYLREYIQSADAIVYAAKISDHSLGARFKLYDDRQFCNGHRTVSMGMPIGYLLEGNYEKEYNLRMVIEGRSEVGHQFLSGVVHQEAAETLAATTVHEIQTMAQTMAYALANQLVMPQNFYGIGGMKIFRDLIYIMRGLMKEDHRFYKAKGFYDFPQKQVGMVLKMQLVGALMSIPALKKSMKSQMNDAILKPYQKIINKG